MMHLQLRHELDLEAYLEPSILALSDGSVRALNRTATQVLKPASAASSLLDLCASRAETLRSYLLACSGSRKPLIEKVSLDGLDGSVDYRCFGNMLTPRGRGRPATILLRLFPVLDARFSAVAERMRRLAAEQQRHLAQRQFDELRSDRLRLVEQYCFVAEALRLVEARTRELQSEISHIRADERERIAQDLHDDAGQEMAAILAELRALQDNMRGAAKRRLDEILEHVAGVGRKIHHAVVGGRPRIVEELGFARAIETIAVSFASDGKLDLSFSKKGTEPETLPIAFESALYRVAQEALTNVLKHARGARKVEIVLEFAGKSPSKSLSLTIADDGAGCPVDTMRNGADCNAGIGLRGMRQRMSDIGGTLDIAPRLGSGMVVTAIAPLARDPLRDAPS